MSTAPAIVALLTDFGLRDSFVGEVKGVILSINPHALIVDITHEVDPQNIAQGALQLKRAHGFFPGGTIFLCVVDPEVGTSRKLLLVETDQYLFAAPDNGLLWLTVRGLNVNRVVSLENYQYMLSATASTFEGRDKLAPAAAYLSLGIDPVQFGTLQSGMTKFELPEVAVDGQTLVGEIMYFDIYGNAVSNISVQHLLQNGAGGLPRVLFHDREIGNIVSTFANTPGGTPLAYVGSADFLELAINRGNFRRQMNANPRDRVIVQYGQ